MPPKASEAVVAVGLVGGGADRTVGRAAIKRPRAEDHNVGALEEENARAEPLAGVPEWVRDLFLQQQQQIQQAGIANTDARISNGLADIDDPLTPLSTPDGRPVPNFPRIRADLDTLSGPQLATLLQAYGQGVPQGLRDRRRAFARHIGARMN